LTYSYDRFGNRWQQNNNGTPSPGYTFDTNNHINNSDSGVLYDVLGNITNDGLGHAYVWDAENRMTTATYSGGSTSYVYDAFGRRVAKQQAGLSQWEYLYDVAGEMTTVFDVNGGWAYGEIYAAGRHLATYSNSTTNFLHADWIGNLRATSNLAGGNSETCTEFPFGDTRSCSGTDWSWLHFMGDEHDSATNLEHTLFRQLSTKQGRWLSPDPAGILASDLGNPQSLNRYAYVVNSPTVFTDALGLVKDPPWREVFEGGCRGFANCLSQFQRSERSGMTGLSNIDEFLIIDRYGEPVEIDSEGRLPNDYLALWGTVVLSGPFEIGGNGGRSKGKCDGFVSPVPPGSPVTTEFRARDASHGTPHSGRDYAVPTGTPVAAPQSGNIAEARFSATAGNFVAIENSFSTSVLMHLSDLYVSRGDFVNAGTTVGLSGNTGHSTGPHLHYELHSPGPLFANGVFNRSTLVEPCR